MVEMEAVPERAWGVGEEEEEERALAFDPQPGSWSSSDVVTPQLRGPPSQLPPPEPSPTTRNTQKHDSGERETLSPIQKTFEKGHWSKTMRSWGRAATIPHRSETPRGKKKRPPARRQLSHAIDEMIADAANAEDRVCLGPTRRTFEPTGGVLAPQARWRLWFALVLAFLASYVIFETPFEMVFVSRRRALTSLQWVNWGVDLVFLVDVGLTFNTAVFDVRTDQWFSARRPIAKAYLISDAFYCDILSLFPWRFVSIVKNVPMLGLLHVLRVLRCVRVYQNLKARRAQLQSLIRVSHKAKLVIKYVWAVVVLVHVNACIVRGIGRVVASNGGSDTLARNLSQERFGHKVGALGDYVVCVEWALSSFFGEATYYSVPEGIFNVWNQLVGLLVINFFVAELTTILCHLDPAGNAFASTSDTLMDFLARTEDVPPAALDNVVEYLHAAEPIFRMKFTTRLMSSLSPHLRIALSHWLLGRQCARIPFIAYCRQRALDVRVGDKVLVDTDLRSLAVVLKDHSLSGDEKSDDDFKPVKTIFADGWPESSDGRDLRLSGKRRGGGGGGKKQRKAARGQRGAERTTLSPRAAAAAAAGQWGSESSHRAFDQRRRATIVGLRRNHLRDVRYDVRYVDDATIETMVAVHRLSVAPTPRVAAACRSVSVECRSLVTQLAEVMDSVLYMRNDLVIDRRSAYNDTLFMVDVGTVIVLGRDLRHPLHVDVLRDKSAFGDDVAMLAVHSTACRVPRWYTARAREVSQLHALQAEPFFKVLARPVHAQLAKYVRTYGAWLRVKYHVVQIAREPGRLQRLLARARNDFGGGAGPRPSRRDDVQSLARTVADLSEQLRAVSARLAALDTAQLGAINLDSCCQGPDSSPEARSGSTEEDNIPYAPADQRRVFGFLQEPVLEDAYPTYHVAAPGASRRACAHADADNYNRSTPDARALLLPSHVERQLGLQQRRRWSAPVPSITEPLYDPNSILPPVPPSPPQIQNPMTTPLANANGEFWTEGRI